ncbi:MAG: hypothetical protein HYZ75_05395 [Elusimicrobia bacterium]|nr:hypothetical protein [Elusimicrobiota bacterium]
MEVVIVVLLPVMFLVLAASMLVVSQLSGFFQFGKYSGRRRRDREELEQFMTKLAMAQSQVARRKVELEKLSARLQDSNEELERLNSMKSKFLSMAVHDVRTPLASIKGFGEMLSRQELGGQQKKYVDYIVRGTDQINRLMGDLTDLAVIEAGKLRLERKPFPLAQMLEDIVPAIDVIARQNGVVLVPPAVVPPVEIVGDRFRLVQALMNFLNNAVKFTPSGGKVELGAKVVGRVLTLAVKDNGAGIHPSERKKVFEKFYQSQFQDMKNKKKGWGLGLAIATEIVRGHGGEIGVDSPGLGKGSTFWYKVPLKPARMPVLAASAVLALGLLASLGGAARAQQTIPLEEKAKFERSLEARAESVLLSILGPSRSRVIVNATLDFTRIEKFDVKTGGAADKDAGSVFLWQNIGAESPGGQELLPGIPDPQAQAPGFGQTKSYERQQSFPTSFVKRLAITVVVDESVTIPERDRIAKILPDVLGLDRQRDDTLDIAPAKFAPAWKTIWYQPEAMGLLFKYGLIALMTLITLVVVAACFLKLAEAMDSMAQAQAHQLQMDFGQDEKKKEGTEGEEGDKEGAAAAAAAVEAQVQKVTFDVGLHQIDTLLEILRGQEPENLALIAAHLKPEVRKAFLARLSSAAYSEVLLSMGSIKFVEPDVVQTVKDELERRLDSAVGGRRELLELIEAADMRSKRDLLSLLELRDPELYAVVRSRVLLFEDVAFLDQRDWSLVMGQVSLEQWAAALHEGEPRVRESLKAQMLPKTWAILEQMIAGARPTTQAIDKAQEQIAGVVMKLAGSGRIQNPVERRGALDGPPAFTEAQAA